MFCRVKIVFLSTFFSCGRWVRRRWLPNHHRWSKICHQQTIHRREEEKNDEGERIHQGARAYIRQKKIDQQRSPLHIYLKTEKSKK